MTPEIASSLRSIDLAVVIPSLDKYGGAERFAIECVARWQDRHRITLYAASFNDALLREHGIGDQVTRIELSGDFPGAHATFLNTLLLPRVWAQEIGKHELYHTHMWPTHLIDLHPMVWYPHEPFRAAYDLRYEQRSRGLHVYPRYDYDHLADQYREPTLAAIRGADRSAIPERIVANSRYTARYLEQVYQRPVNDVVYPGAEPVRRGEVPRDPSLFVTTSQLWYHKRVRVLIEAIALTEGTELIIIGSGPDEGWLRELVDGLGLRDRIFFFSGLSNDELSMILARASAFLFAGIREPFGIAVLEAMDAGLPVIAADEGGYTELFAPDCGFLVPAFPAAFAEKIRVLQADPSLAKGMGVAARARAEQYTWSRTATELEAILIDTLATAAPPRVANQAPQRPLLGAQYYLWYGEGYGAEHWNDSPTSGHVDDKPVLGYYGSNKGTTIDFHLATFERMGLDFAILNLHVDQTGPSDQELKSIEALFAILEARQSDLRVAIQLAPYTGDATALVEVIARFRRKFFERPCYLRHEGAPVLFWFWSTALDERLDVMSRVKQETEGIVHVAMSTRLPAGVNERDMTAGLFAGFAPFSPLELADRSNLEEIWTAAYRLAEEAGMSVRVASISPGYDDTALRDPRRAGNKYRSVPRDNGNTYERGVGWLRALRPAPHYAVVSTFNEYHENSHVEPTLRHGDLYVDMTRRLADALRSGTRGAR